MSWKRVADWGQPPEGALVFYPFSHSYQVATESSFYALEALWAEDIQIPSFHDVAPPPTPVLLPDSRLKAIGDAVGRLHKDDYNSWLLARITVALKSLEQDDWQPVATFPEGRRVMVALEDGRVGLTYFSSNLDVVAWRFIPSSPVFNRSV